TGAVVGEIHVGAVLLLVVHERRVDASGDAIGELADHLWMGGILQRRDHDAVLAVGGSLARVHQEATVWGGHHVVDATGVGHQRVGDDRIRGITDVDRVHPVAAGTGAEIEVLAVGVHPHFLGGESGAGQATDYLRRATNVARL